MGLYGRFQSVVTITMLSLLAGGHSLAQVDPGKFRVQTDTTQTNRAGQEFSNQNFQQFQSVENTLNNDLRISTFEDLDPTEYEMTMQLINLSALPIDARLHPELLHYDLDSGHVLVRPQKRTTVETDEGKIEVGADAIAAILKTADGVTVLDLYDEHKGDVKVYTGDEIISMAPGMQVTLTRHPTKDLKEVHPARFIGHRNLRQMRAADGTRVFMADFSMFAAVARMKRIRDLAHSKKKSERRLFEKILKTAASITILHGLHGKFELL